LKGNHKRPGLFEIYRLDAMLSSRYFGYKHTTSDIHFVLVTINYKPDMQIIWSSIMDSVNAALFDYVIKGPRVGREYVVGRKGFAGRYELKLQSFRY